MIHVTLTNYMVQAIIFMCTIMWFCFCSPWCTWYRKIRFVLLLEAVSWFPSFSSGLHGNDSKICTDGGFTCMRGNCMHTRVPQRTLLMNAKQDPGIKKQIFHLAVFVAKLSSQNLIMAYLLPAVGHILQRNVAMHKWDLRKYIIYDTYVQILSILGQRKHTD